VNFFGHATVASWARQPTPAFVIGAMLPDFATISGARSLRATHPETTRGVALHHATDAVFHFAPDFLALTSLVKERLLRGGVGHGGARAAAHVGVELVLDGALVADARAGELYVRALEGAEAHIACAVDGDAEKLSGFLGRVRRAGIPFAYADPRTVATRVERVLSSRPLLAVEPGHADLLATVFTEIAVEVRARAENLLAHVRRGLTPSLLTSASCES
jgi:hypothetical protein